MLGVQANHTSPDDRQESRWPIDPATQRDKLQERQGFHIHPIGQQVLDDPLADLVVSPLDVAEPVRLEDGIVSPRRLVARQSS